MQNLIEQLTPSLLEIAGILLSALATWIAVQLKAWLDTQQKRAIVESTVKYVEQVGKALGSEEKLALAKERAIARLNALHIKIGNEELETLIESFVLAFQANYKVE